MAVFSSISSLLSWLPQRAEGLDSGRISGDDLVNQFAQSELLGLGVPDEWQGQGGSLCDAVLAISAVARESLTAAFVLWGQRTFIEYLLHSPNTALREKLLPSLLRGQLAGATGLSNAMKFLSGIESLQVKATPAQAQWQLTGKLPWVTNLLPNNFVVAAAVEDTHTQTPRIFAIPHDSKGLTRSDDLSLIALQSSNTAALQLNNLTLTDEWLIHAEAYTFLSQVRPAFLGLQCGLSLGLAEVALERAEQAIANKPHVLRTTITALQQQLNQQLFLLLNGLEHKLFITQPQLLFTIRIRLADIVQQAVQLELQANGGKAYLLPQQGFARRWREAAFIPVVTPSIVQLRTVLAEQAVAEAA